MSKSEKHETRRYAVGFLFSQTKKHVCLVMKAPDIKELSGRWSGIFGRVRKGEHSLHTITREAKQQCGYRGLWISFAELSGPIVVCHKRERAYIAWKIDCFHATLRHDESFSAVNGKEEIWQAQVAEVMHKQSLYSRGLPYLVALALAHSEQEFMEAQINYGSII